MTGGTGRNATSGSDGRTATSWTISATPGPALRFVPLPRRERLGCPGSTPCGNCATTVRVLPVVPARPGRWAVGRTAGTSRPTLGAPLPDALGRLRRAAVPLISLAVAIPVLGIPTASVAAEGPVASFDWSLPDRFGLNENGDGLTDYVDGTGSHPGPVQVNPNSWHVDLDGCGSTDGADLASARHRPARRRAPAHRTRAGGGCDDFDLEVPEEGTYRVALTATKDGASTTTTLPVVVQDWLIVSLGDSSARARACRTSRSRRTSTRSSSPPGATSTPRPAGSRPSRPTWRRCAGRWSSGSATSTSTTRTAYRARPTGARSSAPRSSGTSPTAPAPPSRRR